MSTQTSVPLAAPNIRIAAYSQTPEQPPCFTFTGSAESLAAHLATDAQKWDCVEYIAALVPETGNEWAVWRR